MLTEYPYCENKEYIQNVKAFYEHAKDRFPEKSLHEDSWAGFAKLQTLRYLCQA